MATNNMILANVNRAEGVSAYSTNDFRLFPSEIKIEEPADKAQCMINTMDHFMHAQNTSVGVK